MRTLITVVAVIVMLSLVSLCFAQNALLDKWGPTTASGFHSNYGGASPWGGVANNWSRQWEPNTWFGVYDGETGWNNAAQTSTGPQNIIVAADIELWCATTLAATNVYFHWADTRGGSMSEIVQGTLSGNNGEYVGIEVPQGDADKIYEPVGTYPNYSSAKGFILEGVTDDLGRDISAENFPVEIQFRDNDGTWKYCEDVAASPAGSPVYSLWWLLNDGDTGFMTYAFRFKAMPGTYQPDGHYEIDPAVCVAPVM